MLYFKALLEGLADLPSSVPEVRDRLATQARTRGLAAMHRELAQIDEEAAARIDPNNRQRLLRALEVYAISGKPISSFWAEQSSRGVAVRMNCEPVCLGLSLPREEIHQRVLVRFQHMVDAGLYDEVARLRKRPGVSADTPAMRAVGYRQVWEYLDGRFGEAEMVARATAATRQLAKRQVTWMRSWRGLHSIDPRDSAVVEATLQYLDAVAIVP
jgi:tRNA dimethylallyltransferase